MKWGAEVLALVLLGAYGALGDDSPVHIDLGMDSNFTAGLEDKLKGLKDMFKKGDEPASLDKCYDKFAGQPRTLIMVADPGDFSGDAHSRTVQVSTDVCAKML